MKQEEADILKKNLVNALGLGGIFDGLSIEVEQPLPPPPLPDPPLPDPIPETVEVKPPVRNLFVTVDGVRPQEPISFFHTKKFLGIGAAFAIISGVLAYLLFFA